MPQALSQGSGLLDTNQNKCKHCNKAGHPEDHCRQARKKGHKKGKKVLIAQVSSEWLGAQITQMLPDKAEMHLVYLDDKGIEALAALEENSTVAPTLDLDEMYNLNFHYATSTMNESSYMYEWLADTGSTNHICITHDLFLTYKAMHNSTVLGVGGNHIAIKGCGTIYLTTCHGETRTTLKLKHINYILTNKYNILSIGRWETNGHGCTLWDNTITLHCKDKSPVIEGRKVTTKLYHFSFLLCHIKEKPTYFFTLNLHKLGKLGTGIMVTSHIAAWRSCIATTWSTASTSICDCQPRTVQRAFKGNKL